MNIHRALLSMIALAISTVGFLNMKAASVMQPINSDDNPIIIALSATPTDSLPSTNQDGPAGLIEKLLHNQLPTITCPKDGKDHPTVAEVRRTLWDPSMQPSTEQNSSWKTELEQLVYLPINKNAHTRMVIAMDDLADKEGILNNATKQFIKRKTSSLTPKGVVIRDVLASHEALQNTTSRAFTILRDPIDRFISGTCQELIVRYGGQQFRKCLDRDEDPLDWMDCIIRASAAKGRFAHHQLRQVDHLMAILKDNPNVPISVLSVQQQLNS